MTRRKQSDTEESDTSSSFEQVQADFEFFDPSLDDVAAIHWFLRDWVGRDNLVDTFALARVIGEQDTVGTVIRLQDSTDCLGFITCINAKYVWNLLSPLFSFLRQQFEKSQQLSVFEKCCLDNPEKLGIVISERVMNLPPELSPWLQQALLDEVEWATEDEPTEQRRAMFALEYFLYITQVYLDSDRPKKKRKSSIHNPSSTENILFIKAEDSSYFVHQTSWCLWPISSKQQQQVEDSLEKQKMAMILSKDQMIEAKNDIQKQIV